ncbi:hypothetical protein CW304_16485 [Bacillus sp. UFRGS-B20]|nr:hypothetical protein CW304_16485 [Bacillus sp. UFRGS-B20]
MKRCGGFLGEPHYHTLCEFLCFNLFLFFRGLFCIVVRQKPPYSGILPKPILQQTPYSIPS